MIVIAFHPNNRATLLRVGKLADTRQKIPVLPFQSRKIKIAEDITQQNQLPEVNAFQHVDGFFRPAYIRAQVDVGEDERIAGPHHTPTASRGLIAAA